MWGAFWVRSFGMSHVSGRLSMLPIFHVMSVVFLFCFLLCYRKSKIKQQKQTPWRCVCLLFYFSPLWCLCCHSFFPLVSCISCDILEESLLSEGVEYFSFLLSIPVGDEFRVVFRIYPHSGLSQRSLAARMQIVPIGHSRGVGIYRNVQ